MSATCSGKVSTCGEVGGSTSPNRERQSSAWSATRAGSTATATRARWVSGNDPPRPRAVSAASASSGPVDGARSSTTGVPIRRPAWASQAMVSAASTGSPPCCSGFGRAPPSRVATGIVAVIPVTMHPGATASIVAPRSADAGAPARTIPTTPAGRCGPSCRTRVLPDRPPRRAPRAAGPCDGAVPARHHDGVDVLAVEVLRIPMAVDLAAIVIGALTGGLLAAREGFAVTGVLLLAVSGGLGGGLIRDVLLDVPVVALTNPVYLPTVGSTAMVTFFFSGWLSRVTGLLVGLDALTLGFFTVIGAQKAQLAGLPVASVVFIGVATAVGGAVIRDVLLAQRADIVQPGPYNAVAALIGASLLAVLAGPLALPLLPVAAAVVALTSGLRLLSVLRGWSAPVAIDLPLRARTRWSRSRSTRRHPDGGAG